MFKRMFLMFGINIAFVVLISIVTSLLGVNNYITQAGLNYESLAIFCLVWGFAGSFLSLAISKWSAKRLYGLEIVDNKGAYSSIVNMVHTSSRKAGLTTMPEVGVYESPEMNAFATGPTRNNSLVAVSTGLLQGMTQDEVEGVIAHEVAHIANGDMVTMTLLQGVINAFVMFFARIAAFALNQALSKNDEEGEGLGRFAYFGVQILFEILFGIIGSAIAAWFSRYREYRADAASAKLVGKEKMVAALEKLKLQYPQLSDSKNSAASMQISSKSKMSLLFSSHPPLDDRILALRRY